MLPWEVVQLAQVVSGVEHHEIQKLNLSVNGIESHAAPVSVQIDEYVLLSRRQCLTFLKVLFEQVIHTLPSSSSILSLFWLSQYFTPWSGTLFLEI